MEETRVLRWKEVGRRCGAHQATVRRWATHPDCAHLLFPKPVQVGDGFQGILEHELSAWLRGRPRVTRATDYAA